MFKGFSRTNHLSLFDLSRMIKNILQDELPHDYWIVAEIAEIRTTQNGHAYLQLVERDGERDLAKMRATIWRDTFRPLAAHFEERSGKQLQEGIKILFNARLRYHELYGLSLNIEQIDPSYTLGEMERQKQEVIDKLKKAGIFEQNRLLGLPPVIKTVAVISSSTAAGYQDFIRQLQQNPYGYQYHCRLYQASMQGSDSARTIMEKMDAIEARADLFDVLIIVRGGGSRLDLDCFNHEQLAAKVCRYPLPVMIGIGHERDESVLDLIAAVSLKTPTAVAAFLIEQSLQFENHLRELGKLIHRSSSRHIYFTRDQLNTQAYKLSRSSRELLRKEAYLLQHLSSQLHRFSKHHLTAGNAALQSIGFRLHLALKSLLNRENSHLGLQLSILQKLIPSAIKKEQTQLVDLASRLPGGINAFIKEEQQALLMRQKTIGHLDPKQILARGYSITYKDGVVVRDASGLQSGDVIHTKLEKGQIKSKINGDL